MSWVVHALCAQTDPEIFFPDMGGPLTAAKAVCAQCPVRSECLEDAVSTGDVDYGVRGGLSPANRRKLMRQREARPCFDCRTIIPKGSTEIRCEACRERVLLGN